jgi:hypothetical protein
MFSLMHSAVLITTLTAEQAVVCAFPQNIDIRTSHRCQYILQLPTSTICAMRADSAAVALVSYSLRLLWHYM